LNEKEASPKTLKEQFSKLDKRRLKLKIELDSVIDEMVRIKWKYYNKEFAEDE